MVRENAIGVIEAPRRQGNVRKVCSVDRDNVRMPYMVVILSAVRPWAALVNCALERFE